METQKIAIIGLGRIGSAFLRNILQRRGRGVELVGGTVVVMFCPQTRISSRASLAPTPLRERLEADWSTATTARIV